MIVEPISQAPFFFQYAVFVTVAKQIIVGVLVPFSRVNIQIIEQFPLSRHIHGYIALVLAFASGNVQLTRFKRVFNMEDLDGDDLVGAKPEARSELDRNNHVLLIASHILCDVDRPVDLRIYPRAVIHSRMPVFEIELFVPRQLLGAGDTVLVKTDAGQRGVDVGGGQTFFLHIIDVGVQMP